MEVEVKKLVIASLLVVSIILPTLLIIGQPEKKATITTTVPIIQEKNDRVPLIEGETITVEYHLLISNKTGWTPVSIRTIQFNIENITPTEIITDQGEIPLTFLYPLTPDRYSNPYMIYVSPFFGDRFCLPIFEGNLPYHYVISPKLGCTMYTGRLETYPSGLLRHVEIVISLGGTLFKEEYYVVAFTDNVYTNITIEKDTCHGVISPDPNLLAPGGYVKNGSRIMYVGKVKPDIVLKKPIPLDEWVKVIVNDTIKRIFISDGVITPQLFIPSGDQQTPS